MLKQNTSLFAQYPLRMFGGAFAAERAMFGRGFKNLSAGEGISSQYAAIPSGHLAPSAWALPNKSGYISSRFYAAGSATATASGVLGKNASGTAAGSATASGSGELVVSGAGTAAGSSTATGSLQAALVASGTAAGSSSATATLQGLAEITGTAAGVAGTTATIRADGYMAGLAEVGAAATLTAQDIAAEVWSHAIEAGIPAEGVIRLMAAAMAGAVFDAETGTIKFTGLDGSTIRIEATTDEYGNRSAVTLDPA